MQLTLGIASLFLSGSYDVEADFSPDEEVAFDDFLIYDGGQPWRGSLYLVDAPLADPVKWRNKLAIGLDDAPAQLPPGSHYLHVSEKAAKERRQPRDARNLRLANEMQAAMRKIDRWMLTTERQCAEKPDLVALLNICERDTGLVSLLVDRNLRYVAASESFASRNTWYKPSEASMGTDMVNELMADEEFRAAQRHAEPFFYHYTGKPESFSACYNIFVNETYEARLLVQAPTGTKTHGQLAVAEYLGGRIASVFARSLADIATGSESPRFQQAVENLLAGIPQPSDKTARDLAIRGWSINHRYRVYAFSFMEPENESATRLYYRNRIGHLFRSCCVLPQDGILCCVRNLSLEGPGDEASQQELVLFLRENLCWAGASNDFNNLNTLWHHFREALVALEIGMRSDSMEWHFRFTDFALDYICEQICSEIPVHDLTHPAFEELAAYDASHHTQLLETARTYMECEFNVSSAAKRLDIHRSSMLARLERIDKLTRFDWGNFRECTHLALSFLLE